MPNFCSGHYFLTVLAPVRTDSRNLAGQEDNFSYRQRLLEMLARLPNSEITEKSRDKVAAGFTATGRSPQQSPFARNSITHLARFVLIDAPAFNGRVSGDTLLSQAQKVNPHVAQPADRLTTPYLLFGAELDAPDGSDAALTACLQTLWDTMSDELQQIFAFCIGFKETGATAADFIAYIKRCQVETTLPFNDYWGPGDALPQDLPIPIDTIVKLGIGLVGGLLLWLLCPFLAILFGDSGFGHLTATLGRWGLLVMPLLIAGFAAYLFWQYRRILAGGAKPFPPGAKLPVVLKSLFLQQRFIDFAIATQGRSDAELYQAFGQFIADNRPQDLAAPTQLRGVIGNAKGAWT